MPVQELKEFLDQNGVKYVSVRHSPAFTAQEIAASAHIPGKELAKTVDRKSTRLNSSHSQQSRMPSSA